MIVLDRDLCLSGGAIGADLKFGAAALAANHGLIHWSFSTHKCLSQLDNVVVLPAEELLKADEFLIIANEFVKRRYPTSNEHINNLLRRNWFQVRDSSSCYAVSNIKNGMVDGGTAWGTSMFLMKNDYKPCACYVYCQTISAWHVWSGTDWVVISVPPKPSDIYAGIGSRKLLPNGAQAIVDLYNQ